MGKKPNSIKFLLNKTKFIFYLTQFTMGYDINDKIILFLHGIFSILVHPINELIRIVNEKLYPNSIHSPTISIFSPTVTVKNSDGIYQVNGKESYMVSRHFENAIRKYFENQKRGVFVDVGSYIGKYTIMVANKMKNGGRVISIEPNPNNYKRLLTNIDLNKCNNVTALNVACSDRNAEEKLFIRFHDSALSSLVSTGKKHVLIKCRTLDSILSKLKIKDVNLVKIDVEGAESKVIRGMKNLLKRGKTTLIFEKWKLMKLDEEIFKKHKYKLEQIDRRHWVATPKGKQLLLIS